MSFPNCTHVNVSAGINSLNADIYHVLEGYLAAKVFRAFLHVNKHVHETYIGYRYISLDTAHSRKYYELESFRDRVHSLMLDPMRQLKLSLYLLFHENISDASALGRVHTLTLKECPEVRDVSALGSVHTLTLKGCAGVSDVSALGSVHTLRLYGCDGVSDVSALGSVHSLIVEGCAGLSDVSALGSVHTLTLEGCAGVSDVSALGSVHSLTLEGCAGVSDVSALGSVRTLTYRENNIFWMLF